MLSFQEIQQQYPENLRPFKRFILREYLQYKILEIIFSSPLANKLCFLGGTCLRIVHNQQRFSEDLDFDNFNLREDEFIDISKHITKELEKEGYDIECKNVIKGAFHCYIKFPNILFKEGISGHYEEKILIQLDTEAQFFEFEPQTYILNKFDVFTSIFITPAELLLAQKFYAVINRKRNKGRDFFDIVYLLGKNVKPNYEYLNFKLKISNETQLKELILDNCKQNNMLEMANDVAPFLFNPKDVKKVILFEEYLKQTKL
ncbi:MAG: nucleotidyl transferase AbiEii/AbiGii toxin family protein [Flavobacteriia bacterium]|nr:nucleotidyl transferase AbiEii/AbiGii toxin family protein [Flavobacteriia bacterium]